MNKIFLHGLESSSHGTKGRYFRKHFPDMLVPDFSGSFAERMDQLARITTGLKGLVLVGSSFGGLMATVFADRQTDTIERLVLLAPAFNFPEFAAYQESEIFAEAYVFIGRDDQITPCSIVVPLAQKIFANLCLEIMDDDHFLRKSFQVINWDRLLR